MRSRGFVLCTFIALALSSGALGDDACSGHGTQVEGKCICSTPLPTDEGAGWVGDQCSTQVHRLSLDGKDVQEICGSDHICNTVAPNEPVCFSAAIDDMATTAFHLNLLLSSNNADAAVVISGLLTNFTTTPDASGAPHVVPQVYPNSQSSYSFAVRTTRGSQTAQLKLTRRQLGYGAYTGMYLCATANASTTLGLRAASDACPFDLRADGSKQLCAGRGASDQCPHGTCTCPAPYAPPANWVVTPGLGFEDCSAALMPLQPSVPIPFADLAPGRWTFYSIELLDSLGYELRVWAAASEATQGSLVLFLRHLQPPGSAADQHDLSSESPNAPSPGSWWQDQSVHLALRRTDPIFQPGIWFIGVLNRGAGPVSFTIGAAVYDCPNNCSGRGTCNGATAECTCSEPVSPVSPDCSISLHQLTLGQPLVTAPRDFAYEELVLPGIGERLRTSPGARLSLAMSFTTTDPEGTGLPAWLAGRPALLAAPSLEAALNSTGAGADGASHPLHPMGPVESMTLAARGVEYSLSIGAWAVGDDGSLHALIRNPLRSPLRQVGYNLTAMLQIECPAGCSGHGTCSPTTGECACEAPYIGTDCSVDSSTTACTPGSRKEIRHEGVRGVCWVPCRADGRSFDDQSCDVLQCDGPVPGQHGQLRRKGSEVECVEDACLAGDYTVADESGDFVCTRTCSCPEDGSGCTLSSICLPGSKRCLNGLQLAGDGDTCMRPRRHGVSGGMVFFYCLLSIFLAAGLVVGGKYGILFYEQYRYGRSIFSQGYVSWPLLGHRGNAGAGPDDW